MCRFACYNALNYIKEQLILIINFLIDVYYEKVGYILNLDISLNQLNQRTIKDYINENFKYERTYNRKSES